MPPASGTDLHAKAARACVLRLRAPTAFVSCRGVTAGRLHHPGPASSTSPSQHRTLARGPPGSHSPWAAGGSEVSTRDPHPPPLLLDFDMSVWFGTRRPEVLGSRAVEASFPPSLDSYLRGDSLSGVVFPAWWSCWWCGRRHSGCYACYVVVRVVGWLVAIARGADECFVLGEQRLGCSREGG